MTRQASITSRIARCAPLAVFALVAFGCGHSAPGGPAGDSPSSRPTPSTVESRSAPPPEGAGPEQPAPAAKAPRGIKVASLPIGGGANVPAGGQQCVTVRLLGNPRMPAGVSVVVTGVYFDEGLFSESRSGRRCPDPPCHSFTFTPDAQACGVLVTATAKGSPGSTGAMHLSGEACPDQPQSKLCSRYAHDAEPGNVSLLVVPGDSADVGTASPSASSDTNSG